MPRSIFFTDQIVDAVLSVLKGADGDDHTNGLPPSWFGRVSGSPEVPLGGGANRGGLEHGDIADYPVPDTLRALCPLIFVRGLGSHPGTDGQPTGDGFFAQERIRLVHVRAHDQCFDDDGVKQTNQTRARERYAKIISEVLFFDPLLQLALTDDNSARTPVTLSSSNTPGAYILFSHWKGWDLGTLGTTDVAMIQSLGKDMWAIACDLTVIVDCGGVS
jgi:hypothetical protein